MLLAKLAKLAPLQFIRILFLIFSRAVIPILTYSAFKGDSFLYLLSLSTFSYSVVRTAFHAVRYTKLLYNLRHDPRAYGVSAFTYSEAQLSLHGYRGD